MAKEKGSRDEVDRRIRENVLACARIADEKKGEDIVILDLRSLTAVTDYFLIATGRNPRQLDAVADEIYHHMKRRRRLPIGEEGREYGHWVVMDYGDFVVHLFDPDYRKVYDLDLLWGDAARVEWRSAPPGPSPAH